MVDYSKLEFGQNYYYTSIGLNKRKDKVIYKVHPIRMTLIEQLGNGNWIGDSSGMSIFINPESAQNLFINKEDAIDYFNSAILDAIDFAEYRKQEIIKKLKKELIEDDN